MDIRFCGFFSPGRERKTFVFSRDIVVRLLREAYLGYRGGSTNGKLVGDLKRFLERFMQRCLVTGGAGFIGSHLSERLLEMGNEVTVLDDLSTGRRENLTAIENHPHLKIRAGSITDPVLLAEVMAKADVIYHMAAAVGVKLVADDPVRTIQTNIYPTE